MIVPGLALILMVIFNFPICFFLIYSYCLDNDISRFKKFLKIIGAMLLIWLPILGPLAYSYLIKFFFTYFSIKLDIVKALMMILCIFSPIIGVLPISSNTKISTFPKAILMIIYWVVMFLPALYGGYILVKM